MQRDGREITKFSNRHREPEWEVCLRQEREPLKRVIYPL